MLLAVFMMHETLKGDKSFYAPFLRILPEPSNISEWTDAQLNLLQVCLADCFQAIIRIYSIIST